MTDFYNKIKRFYKVFIILGDIIIVYTSYVLAFLIKFNGELPEFNYNSFNNSAPFILIAALLYFDRYRIFSFYRKTLYDIYKSLFYAVIFLGITAIAITYMLQGFSFPRTVLVLTPFIQFILLAIFHSILSSLSRIFSGEKTVMIISSTQKENDINEKIKHFLKNEKIKKIYTLDLSQEKIIYKKLKAVDEIFLNADLPAEFKADILRRCLGGKQVLYIVPHLYEISLIDSKLMHLDDTPAFMIDRIGLTFEQKILKRSFDIIFSFLGLLFLSPLMLGVALLIKLTSDGPVFYKQERVTQLNKVFSIYKFRTMNKDAETMTGPVMTEQNDPRVTPLGRVLRRLRIDELPQLFNVLYGNMSLVGPRPERPFFVEQFIQNMPEYGHRFMVKAGITGYAQIFGSYDTSPDDKLRYDLMYIRNYSLLLDIKLIFGTFKVLFTVGSASKKKQSEDVPQKLNNEEQHIAIKNEEKLTLKPHKREVI